MHIDTPIDKSKYYDDNGNPIKCEKKLLDYDDTYDEFDESIEIGYSLDCDYYSIYGD